MKLAALLVAAAALAHGQVAGRANAHYRTAEGRAGLVAGMASDYWRDQQKPRELNAALVIKRGITLADVGTGPGFMLPCLSGAVGPSGRVVAADVFPDFIEKAEQRAQAAHLANITVILGAGTDPKLPDASADRLADESSALKRGLTAAPIGPSRELRSVPADR